MIYGAKDTEDRRVKNRAHVSKILSGERLSHEEGLQLLQTKDSASRSEIGQLADELRRQKVGDKVRFASTLCVYPTNLCELNCQFCSFYAKPGGKNGWFYTPQQIEKQIRDNYHEELNEIHIVSGIWRECNLAYYEELFARIKNIDSKLHIKALTPVEYDFLAKIENISLEELFRKMISYGLGSLPGGGAEILVEEIRKKIAPGKISSDQFLDIHTLAHNLGLRSNITMLMGHIESDEDIITHLCKIRALQDETGGFHTFVPLQFNRANNALGRRKDRLRTIDIPLVYAVSRLMLDNIDHIKVLWNYVGVEQALEILNWGANDLSSTNLQEKVASAAGGPRVVMDRATMTELIQRCGKIPQLVHSGAD